MRVCVRARVIAHSRLRKHNNRALWEREKEKERETLTNTNLLAKPYDFPFAWFHFVNLSLWLFFVHYYHRLFLGFPITKTHREKTSTTKSIRQRSFWFWWIQRPIFHSRKTKRFISCTKQKQKLSLALNWLTELGWHSGSKSYSTCELSIAFS